MDNSNDGAIKKTFEGVTSSNLSERQIVEQVSGTTKEEGMWWEKSIEGINLEELESFAHDLEEALAGLESPLWVRRKGGGGGGGTNVVMGKVVDLQEPS